MDTKKYYKSCLNTNPIQSNMSDKITNYDETFMKHTFCEINEHFKDVIEHILNEVKVFTNTEIYIGINYLEKYHVFLGM